MRTRWNRGAAGTGNHGGEPGMICFWGESGLDPSVEGGPTAGKLEANDRMGKSASTMGFGL